ncbi:hypothetical protein E4U54_000954, partial [Claviceps lovelessii]
MARAYDEAKRSGKAVPSRPAGRYAGRPCTIEGTRTSPSWILVASSSCSGGQVEETSPPN